MIAILQLLASTTICSLIIWWKPIYYIGVAAIAVAITLVVLTLRLFETEKQTEDGLAKVSEIWLTILTSLILGLFWPVMPIVLWHSPKDNS